jgi:acetyltransferase-like isoleucine patch superfamily enzyme
LIREGARIELICGSSGRVPDLRIGHNVNIEQNVHIVCHSRIILGADVSVTANCAIVDVTHPFEGITEISKIADRISDEDSFVEIGEGAVLGFGCVVLPNVRIGRRAMIGANAVVTKDVPDYGVAAGVPAKLLRIYKNAD